MGRKGSARGPFAERCFLVGPFRSAARADAPLYREVFSSSLVRMDIGLPALQLRFLATPCLAGASVAALAAARQQTAKPAWLASMKRKVAPPAPQAQRRKRRALRGAGASNPLRVSHCAAAMAQESPLALRAGRSSSARPRLT